METNAGIDFSSGLRVVTPMGITRVVDAGDRGVHSLGILGAPILGCSFSMNIVTTVFSVSSITTSYVASVTSSAMVVPVDQFSLSAANGTVESCFSGEITASSLLS